MNTDQTNENIFTYNKDNVLQEMCKIHEENCKENVRKSDECNFYRISNYNFFIYCLKWERNIKNEFIQLVYLNAVFIYCDCLMKLILKLF